MSRNVVRIALHCAIAAAVGCSLGCQKSKEAVSFPEIKMITPENLHCVMAPDDDHIWVAGNFGDLYHSADGGETWQKQQSGVATLLTDGNFLDASTGWIAGLYGVVLHTRDGGATWNRQETGTDKHLFDVSFVDENYGWAVGEWNTIIGTTDGGTTWTSLSETEDRILNGVQFVDRQTGWVIGEAGTIMKTTDGGASWSVQMPDLFVRETLEEEFENPRPALFGICFIDAMNGWLCGIDATIMQTDDGGASWRKIPLAQKIDEALFSIQVRNGRGWAVGDKGAYVVSTDGGRTWEAIDDVIKSKMWFRDVAFSSPDNGWVVGQGGTAVHTTDGGATWKFRSGLSYAMEFFQMPKALEFKGMVTE
jgi:photosystem II stability/assembly factor-like uncharacterized protein